MLHVILYGTEDPGNIGAIARLMGNFGVDNLLFIEPACNPLDLVALKRAKHSKSIIEKGPLVSVDVLSQFDVLIGTSARTGGESNLSRIGLSAYDCVKRVGPAVNENHVGILFGPESTGLPNDVLEKCHYTVRIPTAAKSSLNLSHAVCVLLYEFFRQGASEGALPVCKKEVQEELLKVIGSHLPGDEGKRRNQLVLWQRLIGKSMLTEKEADMLFGFFRGLGKQ